MNSVTTTKKCFLAPGHPENMYETLHTEDPNPPTVDVVQMMSRISYLRGNDKLHLIPSDVLEQQKTILNNIQKANKRKRN